MSETGRSIGITNAMSRLDQVQAGIREPKDTTTVDEKEQRASRRDTIGAWGRLRDIPRLTLNEAAAIQTKIDNEKPLPIAVDIIDVAAMEHEGRNAPTAENHVTWGGR